MPQGRDISEYKSDYLPPLGATAGFNARGQGARAANNYEVGLVSRGRSSTASRPITRSRRRSHQEAIRHRIEECASGSPRGEAGFLDWQASVDRIHRAEETVEASRRELELAKKRYETGLGTIIELTDAQRRFTEDGAEGDPRPRRLRDRQGGARA